MNQPKKVLELGVEGGSIAIFKILDKENNDWYYHNVNEMSYDDFDLPGVNKNSKYAMSFAEAMIRMIGEYNNALEFYPLYIDLENRDVIIELIKQTINSNPYFDYARWAELLQVETDELKS